MTERASQRVLGVVLAGDRSRREGRDGNELSWGALSWLSLATETLVQIPCERVWVSGERSRYFSVREEIAQGSRPLGSIRSILRYLMKSRAKRRFNCVLIIPVDMPLLDTALLRRLTSRIYGASTDLVHFEGHELPFLILNPTKALEAAESAQSIQDWLSRLNCRKVPLLAEESWKLMYVNEPSDLEELGSRFR